MIGTSRSHYRITEQIGQGGMGEVFLVEDTSLHRKVALKFLPPAMQQDPTARRRFEREARSAAALDHPYIRHINEVDRRQMKPSRTARAGPAVQPDLSPARMALEETSSAKRMRAEIPAYGRDLIAKNNPERLASFERDAAGCGLKLVQPGFAHYWAARYEFGKGIGALGIARRYVKAGERDRTLGWL